VPGLRGGPGTEYPNLRVVGEHFDGAYAEYIALPARSLLSAPDGLGYPELAASIVAYMTAWHMLKAKGGAVHRAVLPGLRFAGLSTRAAAAILAGTSGQKPTRRTSSRNP
jgi:NADPH:quinone reductase-like Zn-dependent oxidoreductase